jgi:hypothetical protein
MGKIAEEVADITNEIHELRAHPDRNYNVTKRLALLKKLVREKLSYLLQGIIDLQEFESQNA